MGDGNRLSESFREIQQASLQELPTTVQSAAPKPVEQKTTSVLQTFLAKVKAATTPNGAQRSHSTAPKSQTVKTLIKSVTNLFSSKVKCAFNKVQASPTENGMPSKLHSLFSKDGSLQRQRVLRDFEQTVLPMATAKNKSGALEATASFLAKADKAGVLDQKLYNSMTRQLDKCLANPRESIVLDDSDSTVPKKTIHQELMRSTSMSPELRTKLDSFNLVKPLQELKQELKPTKAIDRATGEKIIDMMLQAYPPHSEVTFEHKGKTYTALLLPTAQGKPEILVKQEKLGEGAASIVYKAVSLTSQNEVVVKYATSLAQESNEEENAQAVLGHFKDREAIQGPMQLFTLQTPEGPKKVMTAQFYERCDYNEAGIKGQFFVEMLKIPEGELQVSTPEQEAALQAKALGKLQELNTSLKAYFTGPASQAEKMEQLNCFTQEYKGVLTALLGSAEDVEVLLSSYRAVIELK